MYIFLTNLWILGNLAIEVWKMVEKCKIHQNKEYQGSLRAGNLAKEFA